MEITRNLFESMRFPNYVDAIDTTHKPIIAPLFNTKDLYNRKDFIRLMQWSYVMGKKGIYKMYFNRKSEGYENDNV